MSATQLNNAYADYVDDTDGKDDLLVATHAYVWRALYRVPQPDKDDLAHDVTLAIMDALDQGKIIETTFQKYVSGTISKKRSDWMEATWYKNPEDKFCELAKENEEGEVEEYDLGYPRNVVEARQLVIAAEITKRLGTVRASLKGKDAELFDLLRRGLSLHEAAEEMWDSYDATKQRMSRLRRRIVCSLKK